MNKKFLIPNFITVGFLFSSLTGCGGASKVVPIYKGMSIANSSTLLNKKLLDDDETDLDNLEEHDEEIEQDITEIVDIDVETDEEVKYYVRPNETFIVEVHIDNPNDFEIQSFTLNGKKYANYMFKEGSTMELLLLETTAPSISGYTEYTIDAIKYIDGTEIKDVDMSSGNKTIKTGISYTTAPNAEVKSYKISSTYAEMSIDINDPEHLTDNNELKIYLSDGENVVDSKDLVVGNNQVKFKNLEMTKAYQYGVVATFDFVDGNDLHAEWILKNEFITMGAFDFVNVKTTQTEITFDVEKATEVGNIEKIELRDSLSEELVEQGDAETRSFDNLLSNHKYDLYLHFSYQIGERLINDWTAKKDIVTVEKVAPNISISDEEITSNSIKATLTYTDIDSIGFIESVQLFKNDELVSVNSEKKIEFNDLESYTDYVLTVTYKYDLNDGKGVQTKVVKQQYKTSPQLKMTNCRVINTSVVNEGDTIYIQATLVNPSSAVPVSVVVNGETYNVSSTSSSTRVYLEVVNNGQFEGGLTELIIQKINVEIGDQLFSILINENNVTSVYINGIIEFISIQVVNEKNEPTNYYNEGDPLYLLVKINNETGYTIDSFVFNTIVISIEQYTKIDDNTYKIPLPDNVYYLSRIKYHNEYVSDEVNVQNGSFTRPFVIKHVMEISTIDQLMELRSGYKLRENYYYKLTNDLDLSHTKWTKGEFEIKQSVFDGNGHKISNITNASTTEKDPGLSLFSYVYGVVKNLTLDNITILSTISDRSSVSYGAITSAGSGIFENCHVSGDMSFTLPDDNSLFAGGIAGIVDSSVFKDCSIDININAKQYGSALYCGGLVGVGKELTVDGCTINVNIIEKGKEYYEYAGGLFGYNNADNLYIVIKNTRVTGSITAANAGCFAPVLGNNIIENSSADMTINGQKVKEPKE